jgi:hypothetical protein
LDYAIYNDALNGCCCFGRAHLSEAAQGRYLLRNCALKPKALETPTECLKRWDGGDQPSPTCFRAQSKTVGQMDDRQSSNQLRVVEVAWHQLVPLGGRDHVVFRSKSTRREEIELSPRHS